MVCHCHPLEWCLRRMKTETLRVQCWIDRGTALVIFPREHLDDVLSQWPNIQAD